MGVRNELAQSPRHHHPARRLGEVVRRLRRERIHVPGRADANKIEVKQAVEAIFSVKVTNVNTVNRKGKRKRNRRTGDWGKRSDQRRAIVSLAAGDSIEIFGS